MNIVNSLVISVLACSMPAYSKKLEKINLYLGESSQAPYHIHAAGNILANFNLLVLGQLIESHEGFKLAPGSLQSFFYDFKKEAYVLKLKPGLHFHNGRRVVASDLEFTLLRGFYASDRSFFHTYLGGIQGIDTIKPGDRFKSGSVSGVKIIDDLTLEVKLTSQNPSFLHSLAAPYFALVPHEELKSDYLTWKSFPIGVGDYEIGMPFDGIKTVLKSYSKHAPFKQVNLYSRLDKSVEYQVSFQPLPALTAETSDLPVCVRLFEFSNEHRLGRSKEFKLLIKSLLSHLSFSEYDSIQKLDSGMLPSHFWGQSQQKKKLVDAQSLQKKLKLKSLEVIVFAGAELSPKQTRYTEKIESLFKEHGIGIKFIPNSEKFVSQSTAKKYPLRFQGIISDYTDPLIMFSAYRKIGHNLSYSPDGEVLDNYETLYRAAEKAATFPERLEMVKKLNGYSQENIVTAPIAEEKNIFYVDKNVVASLGEQPNPLVLNLAKLKLR